VDRKLSVSTKGRGESYRTHYNLTFGNLPENWKFIGRIFRGIENEKRNPTLATIQKLAEALDISSGELLK